MKKIKDILRLRFITNISYRQISRALNVPSSTVGDYCKRFEIIDKKIDEFLNLDDDEISQILFPEKSLPKSYKSRPRNRFRRLLRVWSKIILSLEIIFLILAVSCVMNLILFQKAERGQLQELRSVWRPAMGRSTQ